MNLPPIEYFFGNTPLNNWIRTCKPYKPTVKLSCGMEIIPLEISPKLMAMMGAINEIHLNYFKQANYFINENHTNTYRLDRDKRS